MATGGVGGRDGTLVGRREELAVVSAAIEHGGCVIAGAPGVGKSRLASEAAERRGAPVVRVIATAAAASRPFGAFDHLLSGARIQARGAIATFVAALMDRGSRAARCRGHRLRRARPRPARGGQAGARCDRPLQPARRLRAAHDATAIRAARGRASRGRGAGLAGETSVRHSTRSLRRTRRPLAIGSPLRAGRASVLVGHEGERAGASDLCVASASEAALDLCRELR